MRLFFCLTLISFSFALLSDYALARGLDYDDDYGDEGGTPDVVYLFIWVAVCASIASLYRFFDKIKKADEEVSQKVFNMVIVGSMAGAFHGFLITVGIVLFAMLVDSVTNMDLSSLILQKTNLIVLFFAALNVGGLMYVLRNGDDVIIRTKDMQILYRDDE